MSNIFPLFFRGKNERIVDRFTDLRMAFLRGME